MLTELDDRQIDDLIKQAKAIGVVLDYVVLKGANQGISSELHKEAALLGMEIIDQRLEKWALAKASREYPFEKFFRVQIFTRDISGEKITFAKFWGTDDAFPEVKDGGKCCVFPENEGYKTAFFNPPYGLRGNIEEQLELFAGINQALLAPMNDANLWIYRWPDHWSNYFEAGKEWRGTFYWTIYNREKDLLIVVGASSSD
jgi:hypothetical protein